MKRLDNSQEKYMTERLSYLRRTMDDLKQLQTFGSSNFAIHALLNPYPPGTDTPPTDYHLIVPAGTLCCFEVTLTPHSSKSNPQIALMSSFSMSFSNASTPLVVVLPASAGIQKWHIWTNNSFATDGFLNLALAFLAISDGSWAVTRIV